MCLLKLLLTQLCYVLNFMELDLYRATHGEEYMRYKHWAAPSIWNFKSNIKLVVGFCYHYMDVSHMFKGHTHNPIRHALMNYCMYSFELPTIGQLGSNQHHQSLWCQTTPHLYVPLALTQTSFNFPCYNHAFVLRLLRFYYFIRRL